MQGRLKNWRNGSCCGFPGFLRAFLRDVRSGCGTSETLILRLGAPRWILRTCVVTDQQTKVKQHVSRLLGIVREQHPTARRHPLRSWRQTSAGLRSTRIGCRRVGRPSL